MDILDAYIMRPPSPQNILDIFEGEWSSRIPDRFGLKTVPGPAALFQDDRVIWAEQQMGGFQGRHILELGPLEGAHSHMFCDRGAASVTAIEANSRAFLKCLCMKEVLGMNRVAFKLGDFLAFLKDAIRRGDRYDLIFASGVLYHMENPLLLLHLMAQVSDRVFLWTHYYDRDILFSPLNYLDYDGMSYGYSLQDYGTALGWAGFCGGAAPTSKWLTRDGILSALKRFGLDDIQISFDAPDHINGPAFALFAQRSPQSIP
ncbi:MAG: hypothetical protein Fur0042_14190 [Cyanophyceae cyanobacterium]